MIDIENKELLTDIFKEWPSFHDAEIVRIKLEREGEDAPYLEADIHVFEMTNEVNPKGHYVSQKDTLVTIRFADISEQYLNGFNHQNMLWDMRISETLTQSKGPTKKQVVMDSTYGCSIKLECMKIKIIKVVPFEPIDG